MWGIALAVPVEIWPAIAHAIDHVYAITWQRQTSTHRQPQHIVDWADFRWLSVDDSLFRLFCVFVDEGGGIDKLAGAAADCDWKSPGKSLTFRQQRFNIPRGHAIVLCG